MGWPKLHFNLPNMVMNILLLMLPLTGGNELNFLKFFSAADLVGYTNSLPVFFSMNE
jgi:hypothetical protein